MTKIFTLHHYKYSKLAQLNTNMNFEEQVSQFNLIETKTAQTCKLIENDEQLFEGCSISKKLIQNISAIVSKILFEAIAEIPHRPLNLLENRHSPDSKKECISD